LFSGGVTPHNLSRSAIPPACKREQFGTSASCQL
jgi:hypothetical protein